MDAETEIKIPGYTRNMLLVMSAVSCMQGDGPVREDAVLKAVRSQYGEDISSQLLGRFVHVLISSRAVMKRHDAHGGLLLTEEGASHLSYHLIHSKQKFEVRKQEE